MNTIFYTVNGTVTEQEPVSYRNSIRQQAQDAFDLLGGMDFDRDTASRYMDSDWRPNLLGDNLDTGEKSEPIEVSNELWDEYKNAILDEVEKLVETAKENVSYQITKEIMEKNEQELKNWFIADVSGNHWDGLSHQLYLDLDDNSIYQITEPSDQSWQQRDDGSLVQIDHHCGYNDIPEDELYTDGCSIYDYGYEDYLDEMEQLINDAISQ